MSHFLPFEFLEPHVLGRRSTWSTRRYWHGGGPCNMYQSMLKGLPLLKASSGLMLIGSFGFFTVEVRYCVVPRGYPDTFS